MDGPGAGRHWCREARALGQGDSRSRTRPLLAAVAQTNRGRFTATGRFNCLPRPRPKRQAAR
eukprot:2963892-Lingulodinium_polyedra.AAC.1